MSQFNIDEIEKNTLKSLKDFQLATVDRVDYLFRKGQNRVLVADEVGMGKTLIARGTIVKMTRLWLEEKKDLFKVIYICPNQNIANQNIRKLDVTGKISAGSVSDTRLSMQHLKITELENDSAVKDDYIQLIPFTPETSFHMTAGGGIVKERALMFAILKRMPDFCGHVIALENFMKLDAPKAWDWEKQSFENRVLECEKRTDGKYPANVIEKIVKDPEYDDIKDMLLNHLKERRDKKKLTYSDSDVIKQLRVMFARISVSMFEPDLVIMDEFQRFKFLLSSDDSELGILAHRFLSGHDTRVLLLSATPYKLYSTLEEIEENQSDDQHYKEFFQVMEFLFDNEQKNVKFKEVWKNYSIALSELKAGDGAIVQIKKQAENAMYQGVCRTERISVMESGDYTDDRSVKKHLTINENDIKSYLQMAKLLSSTGSKYSLPVDYVKSCPYLMSFMKNYKIKNQIEKYYCEHPSDFGSEREQNLLWLNKSTIGSYKELPKTNARLEALKEKAFIGEAEKYLWVPPSKPYYELKGAYKNSKEFSKILVFSSWEMVPRMIGAMLSYEAERRTIGKLMHHTGYFAEGSRRYPAARLRFNVSNGEVRGMSLFCLLYPSETLAGMYSPIDALNNNESLEKTEEKICDALKKKIDIVEEKYGYSVNNRIDERWYYLAPMLMDGVTYAKHWIDDIVREMNTDHEDTTSDRGNKGFFAHIEKLKEYLNAPEDIHLGRKPDDLVDTLVNMALGSPAICIYRSNGKSTTRATALARVFVNNFNIPESIAIIDLVYGRCRDDNSHWQNVLKYCKDGCFQAMFDEYVHMLEETTEFQSTGSRELTIHNIMMESLKIHTATYVVDTYQSFKNRVNGADKNTEGFRLRSSYAVGFTKDAGDNSKVVNRKESIRNAFNSPLRPFVLATTSIGQEGLDFHNYCRVIMHWNLPSNPIDLEQREGRINRFKCLAIRQNVAEQYGNITFKKDIWEEMFEAAKAERQPGQSELVPFWCFGKNQKIKIERLVPMYPMSKDEINYERLIKILSLYRLTLGQARQEELLEYLFREFDDTSKLKNLFIDLSPFSKGKLQFLK